jgi:hypothetical protein
MAAWWNSQTFILLYGYMLQQSNGHIVIWLHAATIKRSYCCMAVWWNIQTVILLYGCIVEQSNGHIVIWLYVGTVKRSYFYMAAS